MTHDLAEDPPFDLPPAGCLALLWPAIPEALVARDERKWLEEAVAKLPPIPRVALELRLEEGAGAVDLHQFISSSEADANILGRYLLRGEAAPISGAPLREFLSDWAGNVDGLRDDLNGLYLEWDRPHGQDLPGAPAIFLPLEGRMGRKAERDGRRTALIDRAERLRPGNGTILRAGVDALGEHLPAGVSVNYLGFMVGRDGAFRVNLRGVRPEALPALLEAIAWPGDAAAAARHFGRLVDLADRVIVGLDLAPRLQPSIGFEAVLDAPPELEPRWGALLDSLCAEGLCTAEKRKALETVHGPLYPEQPGQPWPASWLVAAVLSPPHHVPWLERRISHLKLSIAADRRVSAKAYVSAQHRWSRGPGALPPKRGSAAVSPATLLVGARNDAIAFLLAMRGQDDLWRDFRLPNGASDEWVTAFVGCALAAAGDPRPTDCLRQSLEALLRRQRPEGGWGYNGFSPPDSDSTAWALKFLDAAGYQGPAAPRAKAFLLSHLSPDGGFSTYAATTPIRFANCAPESGDAGWRGSHLCVAANAAGPLTGALSTLLRAGQSPEGCWRAYWWRNDIFSTALAVEALASEGAAAEQIRRAVSWARRQLPAGGSAFDRAWLVRILLYGSEEDRSHAETLAAALASDQRADGSWPSGAFMLFPSPSKVARDPGAALVLDDRRVFTTASVLMAIGSVGKTGPGV